MGINRLAFLWGLAEATFFFIVPDVLLSIAGKDILRKGLIACAYALGGALLGGVLLFWAGNAYQSQLLGMMEKLPAISEEMIESVHAQLTNDGAIAVLIGPTQGVPYKLYAVQAQSSGLAFGVFLLISIPARMIRFMLVTISVHYLGRGLDVVNIRASKILLILIGWIVFYLIFFIRMDN